MAFSAKGVAGSVLHQPAMLAAHYFACLHADKSGCHRLGAECQSGHSGVLFCTAICATFEEVNHNCQVET